MNCTDQRIVDVCNEIFLFLRSGERETSIHTKQVRAIEKGNVRQADIDIGFVRIRLVYKPLQVVLGQTQGSDEGASAFIYLPFKSPNGSDEFVIKGYFSTRGTEKVLSIIAAEEYVTSRFGTRRVVDNKPIDNTRPF